MEITYTVRKHGAVKVTSKEQASQIVELGKKEGYNFSAKKEGWNWLVIDMDN